MIRPIWQDCYVQFNTEDSPVNYSINLDGEAIFYGKAWAAPAYDDYTFKTNIKKICENYLSNTLPDFRGIPINGQTYEQSEAAREFVVVNEDNSTIVGRFTFVYDWSYDDSVFYSENSTVEMSHPINRKGKDGMFYFQTTFDGSKVETFITQNPINGYTVSEDCNSKWAMYYLNRYGGWDSYLIEGYVSKKDNFVRKNIVRDYDNNTKAFGNAPYMTQITPTYEIHTGWLNDRESEIMAANVFQSTRVYLHNLETFDLIPVNITDADVLYKTHKNSGRRLLNYTINATEAQTEYNKN